MSEKGYSTFTGTGRDAGRRNYVISPDKARTVDFAIKLGRPLLVEGEAGCGKTRLADAVADELGLPPPTIIPVRSSSRANDLFYKFDALRRLQDSQIPSRQARAEFAHNYVLLEPLGEGIRDGGRRVLLIDEVDKGDVDFQNDLLFSLDRFEFVIDEIPAQESEMAAEVGLAHRLKWPGGTRPIVMFTSNREKQLPLPFLRRCIYLELTFPDNPEELTEIVVANLRRRHADGASGGDVLAQLSKDIIDRAVASFLDIRREAEAANAIKKPATAELIDWVHVLHWEPDRTAEIAGNHPPHWQMLFRSAEDIHRHARLAGTPSR